MTWSEAFDAYLVRNKIKAQEAAVALGVAASTVHYWRRGSEPRGEKGLRVKRRVEAWSRGDVKAAPWPEPRRVNAVAHGDESGAIPASVPHPKSA